MNHESNKNAKMDVISDTNRKLNIPIVKNRCILYHIIYIYKTETLRVIGKMIARLITLPTENHTNQQKQNYLNVLRQIRGDWIRYDSFIFKPTNIARVLRGLDDDDDDDDPENGANHSRNKILIFILFALAFHGEVKALLFGYTRLNDLLGVPAPSMPFQTQAWPYIQQQIEKFLVFINQTVSLSLDDEEDGKEDDVGDDYEEFVWCKINNSRFVSEINSVPLDDRGCDYTKRGDRVVRTIEQKKNIMERRENEYAEFFKHINLSKVIWDFYIAGHNATQFKNELSTYHHPC